MTDRSDRRLRDLIAQWRGLQQIRSTSRIWQDFDRDQQGADAEGWRPLDPGERAIFACCAQALEAALDDLGRGDPALAETGCDHKFLDTNPCVKCGWVPPLTLAENAALADRRARREDE